MENKIFAKIHNSQALGQILFIKMDHITDDGFGYPAVDIHIGTPWGGSQMTLRFDDEAERDEFFECGIEEAEQLAGALREKIRAAVFGVDDQPRIIQ